MTGYLPPAIPESKRPGILPQIFDNRKHAAVVSMTMYFMLYLDDGDEIATKLRVHGDYLHKPEKTQETMRKLQAAIEREGRKITGMRPISKREYRVFVRKYDKGDADVVRF